MHKVSVGGRQYAWRPGAGLDSAVVLDLGGLATWAALKWRGAGRLVGADLADLRQACYVGILLAARQYTPGPKGFVGLAIWRMHREMRRLCGGRRPFFVALEGAAEPAVEQDGAWAARHDAAAVMRRLAPKDRAELRARYGLGRPAADVAAGAEIRAARAAIGLACE
jgi:DNA-directed RNA polymerase specialized sigma24 family protein